MHWLIPSLIFSIHSSPVGIAWDHVLSGNRSAEETYATISLFKDTDYLSTREFTILHKIVLGLVSKDLALELQCSTATINTPDCRGRTPLSWASARGDTPTIRTLLAHGADPNLPNNEGNSPLHYVKNAASAQLLLDHGADIHARNVHRATPLYALCQGSDDLALLTLFLSAGADVNAAHCDGETPLHCCAFNSHTQCFEQLVLHGADPNVRTTSGDSALSYAIMFNAHDAIRFLLATQRANFSGINAFGHTFAHVIAQTADLETVEILLAGRTDGLCVDKEVMDLEGKTCGEYFAERMAFVGGDNRELEDAFARLARKLRDGEKADARATVHDVVEELAADVEDKLDINIAAVELIVDRGRNEKLVESA